MQQLNEFSKLIAAMSPGALVTVVLLAAFALAAYAIHAVLTATRRK